MYRPWIRSGKRSQTTCGLSTHFLDENLQPTLSLSSNKSIEYEAIFTSKMDRPGEQMIGSFCQPLGPTGTYIDKAYALVANETA